jgi:three-Cys-motif partner protein
VRKRRVSETGQGLLFTLPENRSAPSEVRFEQSEHPVWTENKARLIEEYLYLFVLLTKHGTYIDGFAGPQRPTNPEMWSAKLVLEREPHWLRNIFLFDKSDKKVKFLCGLRKSQASISGRKIRIFHGDFNVAIHRLLEKGQINQNDATFCLLDQWTFQCHWSTVSELAMYRGEGKPKIELFYFLAVRWLKRALKAVQKQDLLKNWWGRDDWAALKDWTSEQIKEKLVSRFKAELGYRYVLAWPIYKQIGSNLIVYFMIHASDHAEAPKFMARAYNDAVQARGTQLWLPGIPSPNPPSG